MSEQNSMRASASEFLNWIMLGGFVALAATTGKLPEDPKKAHWRKSSKKEHWNQDRQKDCLKDRRYEETPQI
jgi:hypothetical protein